MTEELFGAFIRLTLRARCARAKLLDRHGWWECRFCREQKPVWCIQRDKPEHIRVLCPSGAIAVQIAPGYLSNRASNQIIQIRHIQKTPQKSGVFICGASGGIIRRVHAPHPSGSLCSCKIVPDNFVEQGFLSSPPNTPDIKKPTKMWVFLCLVHPEGFEPPTKWFEATYSIQLSYGCMCS